MSDLTPRGDSPPNRPNWTGFIFAKPFEDVEWPEVSLSVRLIADAIDVLPEEFHGRRLELARTFLAGRPATARRLALVHELVVAEKEVDYWRYFLVNYSENSQLDMLKYARGALNDARRAHAKADAAIEREQRSFEKADAAEKAAAEKRAFTRERDALRIAEKRAARKEKYDERERIRLASAEERRRRDAEKRAASSPHGSANASSAPPVPSAPADAVPTSVPPSDDQSGDDTVLETPTLAPLGSPSSSSAPSTFNSLPSTLSGASPAAAPLPPSGRERRRQRKHRRVHSPV